MVRRVVAILLIAMICTVLISPGLASKQVTSGSFYGLSWMVTDGVLILGEANTTQMVWFNTFMNYDDWPWDRIRDDITEVRCAGSVVISGSVGGLLESCKNLKTADLSLLDVSKVTDMTAMFAGCQSLMYINIDTWDTSRVVSMERMFRYCSNALSFDLSMLNTANVTTMYEMFYMCEHLVGLNLAGWDISKVDNLDRMFAGCTKLTQLHLGFGGGWSMQNIAKITSQYNNDVPKWLMNADLTPVSE